MKLKDDLYTEDIYEARRMIKILHSDLSRQLKIARFWVYVSLILAYALIMVLLPTPAHALRYTIGDGQPITITVRAYVDEALDPVPANECDPTVDQCVEILTVEKE